MLKRPVFNTNEFNSLCPSLWVIEFWQEIEKAESGLKELKEEQERRAKQSNVNAEAIKALLLEGCCSGTSDSDETVLDKLEALCHDIRKIQLSSRSEYLKKVGINDCVKKVYDLFCPFQADDLEDALSIVLCPPEDAGEESAESLNNSITALTKNLNAMWRNCGDCFRTSGIPKSFRGMTFKGDDAEIQMGKYIIMSFISTWRTRAPLFRTPVTIYGVKIRSMSPDLRDKWNRAYDALGLSDIPKSIAYEEDVYQGDDRDLRTTEFNSRMTQEGGE